MRRGVLLPGEVTHHLHRKTWSPEKRVFHAEFVKNGFSGVFHGFGPILGPVKNTRFSRAVFHGCLLYKAGLTVKTP